MSFGRLGALGRGFGHLGGGAKGGLPAIPNTLRAGTGSFILTGTDMTPKSAYVVPAALGTFALTGIDATLTSTAASYTGPGNVVSGATAWVSSARAYSAAFAAGGTAVMDLQDQAGANPITINILTTGFVDVSAITTWVAAHSVSTIKVAKLYDQTGNGNHFTQATLGTMPALTLSALNGLPGLTFASASNTTINTAAISFTQPYSMSGVYKRTSGTTGGNLLAGQAGAGVGFGPGTVTNFASVFGPTEVTVAATDNAFHALGGVFNAASSAVVGDGTVVTGNAGLGNISAALFRIGRSSAGNTLDGIIMEAGVWGTLAMTTGGGSQTDLLNTNQHSAASGYNF